MAKNGEDIYKSQNSGEGSLFAIGEERNSQNIVFQHIGDCDTCKSQSINEKNSGKALNAYEKNTVNPQNTNNRNICNSLDSDVRNICKNTNPNKSCGENVHDEEDIPALRLEKMMMARNAAGVNEQLKKARVGIAGLGGLGSNIAFCLARAGVGFLHLVDFDVVEPSNLNRQQYRLCHLGMNKADALKQQIAEINPFVTVKAEVLKVTKENAEGLFENDDIVCEAFDDSAAKAMLVNTLLTECPKRHLIAASGMAGLGSGNDIKTRRFSDCFYLCGDGKSEYSADVGIMSPRVMICAGHQANTVLRLILGETEG